MDTACTLIVTFPTVHHALKCESVLGTDGVSLRLMPVPRRISSSCGLAAEIVNCDPRDLENRLHGASIEFEAIYQLAEGCEPELMIAGPGLDPD